MVKRGLVILVGLWFGILLFTPWKELYFYLENQLKPRGIVLGGEKVEELPYGFRLLHPVIYLKGARVGTVRELTFRTLLFASDLKAEWVSVTESLQRFIPTNIDRIALRYVLWNPTYVSLHAEGTFGSARGELDLQKKRLFLKLEKVGEIKHLRPYLKKIDGVWTYEYSF
jgi:hypothetical protein